MFAAALRLLLLGFFTLVAAESQSSSQGGGAVRPQQSPAVPPRRFVRKGPATAQQSPVLPPRRFVRQGQAAAPRPSVSEFDALPAAAGTAAFSPLSWSTGTDLVEALASGFSGLPLSRWEVLVLILLAKCLHLMRKHQVASKWVRALVASGRTTSGGEAQDTITLVLEMTGLPFARVACRPAAQAALRQAINSALKQVPLMSLEAVDVLLAEAPREWSSGSGTTQVQVVVETATGLGAEIQAVLAAHRLCENVAAAVRRVESIKALSHGPVDCTLVRGPELLQAGIARGC